MTKYGVNYRRMMYFMQQAKNTVLYNGSGSLAAKGARYQVSYDSMPSVYIAKMVYELAAIDRLGFMGLEKR